MVNKEKACLQETGFHTVCEMCVCLHNQHVVVQRGTSVLVHMYLEIGNS